MREQEIQKSTALFKGKEITLVLAIEALEKAMETIDDIANPRYCDCCDKGYEDRPCTCFEDSGGANRATICQKEVAEILSVKEE